ncbi:MAG: hypothetical protein JXR97_03160, partial [Planctomycetes bacterium]|nr:hypothetical protein [Planctomycetota bacterium]
PLLASVVTKDPLVREILQNYIRIISFGYGMMEVHRYSGIILTGLHRPFSATMLNSLRVILFLIPLSLAGAYYYDVDGVFWARLVTDVSTGFIGLLWVHRVCQTTAENMIGTAPIKAESIPS